MQEIEIKVNQVPAEISFNYSEIKAALEEQMQIYRELEVNADNLPERKKDIATLRKMAKALDGKRKESKEAFMQPYTDFEAKAKELLAIIQQPIDLLDKQVKQYEEQEKEEKKKKAQEYFEKAAEGTRLRFEDVFQKEWLNVNTSFKSIRADIDVSVSNYKSDIAAIQAAKSEIEEKALEIYHQSGRLAAAIQIINDYEEQKKRILEAEERRRKEAEEREAREAEERAKREAAEKARRAELERAELERRIREEERAKLQAEVQRQMAETESERSEEIEFPVDETPFIDEPEEEAFADFPGDEEEPEEYDSELAFPGAELQETFLYKVTATLEQHHAIMEYLKGHSEKCERSE